MTIIEIELEKAEESFWSIFRNENRVVIPLITELDEPFIGVDGDFKSSE